MKPSALGSNGQGQVRARGERPHPVLPGLPSLPLPRPALAGFVADPSEATRVWRITAPLSTRKFFVQSPLVSHPGVVALFTAENSDVSKRTAR